MRLSCKSGLLFLPALLLAQGNSAWRDPSPHKKTMVTVETAVSLEVLDWGGSGRPIVLLAGLGNTAHVFDNFAPNLTRSGHVYGITRRGFGASSAPDSGYDPYRLGDDIVAVLDHFKLRNPVLAGHSISGEELSSVDTRHPGRAAAFIYLDALYPYAFDNGKGWTLTEFAKIMSRMPQGPDAGPQDKASPEAYAAWVKKTNGVAFPEGEIHAILEQKTPPEKAENAVFRNTKQFTDLRGPMLAICSIPIDLSATFANLPAATQRAEAQAALEEMTASYGRQIEDFQASVPGTSVVRLAHANHYNFISNEADVLREMNAFLRKLPK